MKKRLTGSSSMEQLTVLLLIVSVYIGGCSVNSLATTPPATRQTMEAPATSTPIIREPPTPAGGIQAGTPRVSPYVNVTVKNVEIRYLETNPIQVELVISGTLPDQCTYKFYSIENRGNQTVKVSLAGIHPSTTSCSQEEQTIEYILPLGRDLPENERGFAPGEYKLTVNQYETSFTVKK